MELAQLPVAARCLPDRLEHLPEQAVDEVLHQHELTFALACVRHFLLPVIPNLDAGVARMRHRLAGVLERPPELPVKVGESEILPVVTVPAPDPLRCKLLPPELWLALEFRRPVLPVARIGCYAPVRVQETMLLEPSEVFDDGTAVEPEQSGDRSGVRSLPCGVKRMDGPEDGVLDVGQFRARSQAVDGRGLELILPLALWRPLAVEVLLLVRKGSELLVGETVLLEP